MTATRPIVRDAFRDEASAFRAGRLGLRIFLASLGMLFAAAMIGSIIVLRDVAPLAPDLTVPPLPRLLVASTGVLLLSSASMQWALVGVRAGRQSPLRGGLLITLALGAGFLVLQGACWLQWQREVAAQWEQAHDARYLLAAFHVLTGMHALHVVGGLMPMLLVARRALAGRYSPVRHAGVHYVAMYWHFLGVVWVMLYATLLMLM